MFVDTAKIKIIAGKGGDGKVSFRREKFVPKGGPDGGNGGKGGSVFFVADHNMATLMDFRTKPVFKAQSGEPGGKKNMTGKDGADLFIKFPVGTLIYDAESGLAGDLATSDQEMLVAKGGVGGRGNESFKSSTNVTPYQFTYGKPGESKEFLLELKMIADVGLIGLPNAGKSTLINQLAKTSAKVANYPFTTTKPNLGVYRMRDGKTVILADIPGLIEGASKGKGLGVEFLRHIERTRVLLHVVDGLAELSSESAILAVGAVRAYKTVRGELAGYGANLPDKPEIVVVNKMDITEVKSAFVEIRSAFLAEGVEVLGVSAATGEGIDELEGQLMKTFACFQEDLSQWRGVC